MRILLIDDDAAIRKLIRMILEKAGFEVVEAADGKAGIRAYRNHGADVVLCDLFMPDLDGLEVIRGLCREFPDVKVIALSGGGFQGTVDMLPAARVLGAVAVLHKPFKLQEILAAIHQTSQPLPAGLPSNQKARDKHTFQQDLIRGSSPDPVSSRSACRGDLAQPVAC
jgi:DNA-binding response OmpR family regulator